MWFFVICGSLIIFLAYSFKGAYIKYVGGGARGFYKIFQKIFRSQGDNRPKYFIAQ